MWILVKKRLVVLMLASASPALAGDLAPCPESPNCVSSQAQRESQKVDALLGGSSAEQARTALLAVLEGMPRVTVTADADGRIEAEFTSAVMRFTDDVVFVVNDDGSIDVRSASRVGYWDLGANRRRVEDLQQALLEQAAE
mgnify:CR=1 FL=1